MTDTSNTSDELVIARPRKIVEIAGKKIEINALTLGDIIQCRTQALDEFRRDKIRVWTKNADLLPEARRDDLIMAAFERAENITVNDLPKKTLKLPKKHRNGKLEKHPDGKLVMADQQVEYAIWWAVSQHEGKLFSTWLSVKRSPAQSHFTLEQIDEMFSPGGRQMTEEDQKLLDDVANQIGELSESKLGNESCPPTNETEAGNTTNSSAPST